MDSAYLPWHIITCLLFGSHILALPDDDVALGAKTSPSKSLEGACHKEIKSSISFPLEQHHFHASGYSFPYLLLVKLICKFSQCFIVHFMVNR